MTAIDLDQTPADRASAAPRVDARTPAGTPAADPFEPRSVSETVDKLVGVAVEKAQHPLSYLVRSLVGGGMVCFGVLLSLTVSAGVTVPGLASLLMGLAFGFSLVLILVSGMSLITADMAAGMLAVLERRLSWGGYAKLTVVGWIGNVLGAFAFAALVAAAGGPYLLAPFVERASAVAGAKASGGVLTAILLGVLCTWFLQTAMFLYFKARSDTARMSLAFYGPFAFVIGGTQHVIANVGFLGLPLLIEIFHPDAISLKGVSWGLGVDGLVGNLLYTSLGNLVGGALLVALPFWVIARLQRGGK